MNATCWHLSRPLMLVSLAACASCSEETAQVGNDVCRTFNTALSINDRMDQPVTIFNAGEDITFKLQVANATNAPATLTAGSSCTAVVFEVFGAAKQRLWGSADGIACVQALQPRTYQAYETVQYSATWSPVFFDNLPIQPIELTVTANVGQYVTQNQSLVDCRKQLSKTAAFTIR